MANQVLSDNEQKLRQAFISSLSLGESDLSDNLQYGVTPGWDSVAHMVLVASIDSSFNIMLDIDDVIDMSSYAKTREILTKYGITF